MTPGEALGFGLTLAAFSVSVLGLLVSWFAAVLLAFTIFFYVVIYTIWLKRWTPQNIVIGGAAGAFPPMIGWAAATGGARRRASAPVPDHLLLDAAAFLGAVAHSRRRLCARRRADAAGRRGAASDAAPDSALFDRAAADRGVALVLGYADAVYGAIALVAGALMIGFAWRLRLARGTRARRARGPAIVCAFRFCYLFVLFAVLLIEGGLGGLFGRGAA